MELLAIVCSDLENMGLNSPPIEVVRALGKLAPRRSTEYGAQDSGMRHHDCTQSIPKE